ncbi:MAG: sulfurtransferase TusA family protein [Candidatus Hermodarchaeota archaeon]
MNSSKVNMNSKVHKLDLRGKICPMTFVYTKLQLEKMNSGELLEVTLDFPAAIKNVPDSCKRQNLGETIEISETDKKKKEWILKIRKI